MLRICRSIGLALFVALTASTLAYAQFDAKLPSPRPSEYGRVILDCVSEAEGRLSDCKIMMETPAGGPFGQATLDGAQQGLVRDPFYKPGSPPGRRTLVPIDFPKSKAEIQSRRLAAGATATVADTVGPGDTIVTLPYEFRRTGVLKTAVNGYGLSEHAVLAPAGAVGFYAGMALSPDGFQRGGDMWCFLGSPEVRSGEPLCLMLAPRAAIILPIVDPFNVDQINMVAPDYASPPDIDEKPVQIPGDLRLAFRFLGWKGGYAEVERWVNGRKAATFRLEQGRDGGVRLSTFVGDYRLDPIPQDRRRALVTAPSTAPAPSAASPP